MIGGVALSHDAIDSAEAINQEVIGPLALNAFEQRFADPFERSILRCLEGRLAAFGAMEDDAGRLGSPHSADL